MRMRRLVSGLLAAALVLLFAGCSHEKTPPAEESGAQPAESGAESADPGEAAADPGETAGEPGETAAEAEPEPEPEPVPVPGETARRLDGIARRYGCVAVQAAVIRGGRVAYLYEYGSADRERGIPVEENTKFRCASLSKLVVAMTVLSCRERLGIDLDGDIGEYLGFSVRSPSWPGVAITPRMLMSHTSSVVDGAAFFESRNAHSARPLREILGRGSVYSGARPGARYVYSNFGPAVMAAAVETVAGESFDALAKRELFEPLGLDCGFLASDISDPALVAELYASDGSVGYGAEQQLAETACEEPGRTHHLYQGNLTISAADYARLLCVLLNAGPAGETLLSSADVDELLTPLTETDCGEGGLCVELLGGVLPGRVLCCHTGSNYGMYSSFAFDREEKSGVVVLTSGADASIDESGLYNVCEEIVKVCYDELPDA